MSRARTVLALAAVFAIALAFSAAAAVSHKDLIKGPFKSGPDVTKKCLQCHEQAAHDVMKTTHWTWSSRQEVPGRGVIDRGKKNTINNFCISVSSNWPRCTSCHTGYGWKDAGFDFTDRTRVDCLVCHIKSEISRLREEIHRLEEEEKRTLAEVTAEDKALRTTEENFASAVETLEKEISETRGRVTRYLFEGAAPLEEPLVHPDMEADAGASAPGEELDDFEGMALQPGGEKASGNTKTCPNCQNQMDWYDFDKKWKCFVCAHEAE